MVEPSDPIDPRISQANERTLLAWIRTGLALMAFGFLVERLAVWFGMERNVESQTTTLTLGAAIVGLGALCQIIGAARFMAVKRALAEGRTPPSGIAGPVLIAVLTAIMGLGLLAFLLSS